MQRRSETESPIPADGFTEDRRLVLRAREGDRTAFADLVRKYAGVVRALVSARLGSGADADDAAQDVFLLAFRRLPALTDPERFAGWLSRIAVNKAVEIRRRNARRATASLDVLPVEPVGAPQDDRLETEEDVARMNGHLAELDETTRTVLHLRFREGLSVKDIAARLNAQPPAVSMRITRALRRLRQRMQAPEERK